MSKVWKDNEDFAWMIVRVILLLVVLAFTFFGFVFKQDCDLDAIYLWCRLHPLSIADIIGCILFYGGAFLLSGLWEKYFTLWEEENTTKWNTITFAGLVLGIVLIWNF